MNFKLLPEYAPYRKYYVALMPAILLLASMLLGVNLEEEVYSEKIETAINSVLLVIIPILVQVKGNTPS